jgi:gliding motility-associated-like protein
MKKHLYLLTLLLCISTKFFAQPSAIRVNSSAQVVNTIIYDNPNMNALPSGISTIHSASDWMLSGTNNVHLLTSPFSATLYDGFGIDSTSAAFNAGTLTGLRPSDTLCLGNKPRVCSEDSIDIGAYGFIPAKAIEICSLNVTLSAVNPNDKDCSNGSVASTITGGTEPFFYEWKSEDGLISTDRNLTNTQNGIYTLIVADSKGCEDTATVQLGCTYKFVMQSTYISPNGDGINDYLNIKYIEHFPINKVTIIDSYGGEIRTFQNYNNRDVVWDGRNRSGKIVPEGTYYYILEAEGLQTQTTWIILKLSE